MNKLANRIAPMLAALLLAACSTTPVLNAPALPVPAAFKEASQPVTAADGTTWKSAQPAEAQPRGQWWLAFHDPALNAMIEQATSANASLAGAAARVRQARAIAGIAESDRSVQL
ncbi:MAG: RND transporter, partial [Telluria sp.]